MKPNVDQCKMANQQASARIRPLSLLELSPAFVLLGLGISLAVLVFLLELIYKRINDHYFSNTGTVHKIIIKAPSKPPGDKKGRAIKGRTTSAKNKQGNAAATSKTLDDIKKGDTNVDIKQGPDHAVPIVGNQTKVTPNWDEIKEI